MMYLKNLFAIIKSNRIFFVSFLVIWLIGSYYQLMYAQFALSIWINNWHTPIGDTIMVWMTYAGDGYFLFAIGAVLIALKKKWWLTILTCLIVPSLITQFLKHQVFNEYMRPSYLMDGIPNLHYVVGEKLNKFNSLPSGHTTAAFSLYTLLALFSTHKSLGWFWVIVATVVAISRVYLLQHFWVDILVGALIGTIPCTLLFAIQKPKHIS